MSLLGTVVQSSFAIVLMGTLLVNATLSSAMATFDCSGNADQVSQTAAPIPALMPSDASQFDVGFLVSARVDALPAGPLEIVLRRVELATKDAPPAENGTPGPGLDPRPSQGVLLYFVQSGEIDFYLNGSAQTRHEGQCVVVTPSTEIGYISASDQAVLLRLSIAPPGTEGGQIASFPTATDASAQGWHTSTRLFSADNVVVPEPPIRLFLTSLAWTSQAASSGWRQHPGPVGLRLERGALTIRFPNASRDLPEQGCIFIPEDTVYSESTGNVLPTILLFGALPEGETLWSAVTEPTPTASSVTLVLSEVHCSD
jgi:hypothetical protein